MKRGCTCRDKLLHRLAQGFGAPNWAGSGAKGWSALALSGLLGGLDEEEARLLLRLGAVEEKRGRPFEGPERASDEAVLAFLERHGEWWFRLRLQKEKNAIRRRIASRGQSARSPR